jgi:hypothetical protein
MGSTIISSSDELLFVADDPMGRPIAKFSGVGMRRETT